MEREWKKTREGERERLAKVEGRARKSETERRNTDKEKKEWKIYRKNEKEPEKERPILDVK